MMKNTLLALLATAIFLSCQAQRFTAMTPATAQKSETAAPEILFLQVSVWKRDTVYGAELRQKQRVAGLLNRDLRGVQWKEGQWLVNFLDAQDNIIAQVTVLNPLEEHYETEGVNGELRQVEVKKQVADCFIRVQYDARFSSIRIEQIQPFQQLSPIISLSL